MKKANRSVSSDSRATFFPQSPVDGQQHGEHGRIWQWVADPGMWRSVTGGATIDGDLATQDALDAEIQDREDGDTALGSRIDAEEQARSDGDDALGLRIDAVEGSIGDGGGFIDAPNDGKLYGRESEAWAEVVIPDGGASSWNDLTDKPTEFPPSAHNHTIAQVTGLQTELDDEAQARADGDSALQGQINALPEALTYQIGTDKVMRKDNLEGPDPSTMSADPAIELVDSNDNFTNVKFQGQNGITVTSDLSSIIIDASGASAGGVDPGTASGQMLRWDGTDWKHTSKVMLDTHGMMTVDSGKIVGDECGLHFDSVTEAILPISGSGSPSGITDLGSSGSKFYNGFFNGTVSASSFSGDGSNLTNLPSGVHIGETPPAGPLTSGQQWMEVPANGEATLYIYDGQAWLQSPGAKDGKDGKDGADGIVTDGIWSEDADGASYTGTVTVNGDLLAAKADAGANAVAVGSMAGNLTQGASSTAVGVMAGRDNQGVSAVSVGNAAGVSNQGDYAVAIGVNAAGTDQGENAVAVGHGSGVTSQGEAAVAIGFEAGKSGQAGGSTALGRAAGRENQSAGAVSVGNSAGRDNQGERSIAIGYKAGITNQAANGIIISSTGSEENAQSSAHHITIKSGTGKSLTYNGTDSWAFSGGSLKIDGVPVTTSRILINTLSTLRNATQDETTLEGLRDALSDAIGGIVQNLEHAIATQEISE